MTGRDICEAYMRFIGVPEERVEDAAREFWEMSSTGDLWHMFAARRALEEASGAAS